VWAVPEVVLTMLADTATVVTVASGFVHFVAGGVPVRLPVQLFRTLYEPAAP
jgi:hypothetical protein